MECTAFCPSTKNGNENLPAEIRIAIYFASIAPEGDYFFLFIAVTALLATIMAPAPIAKAPAEM